MHAKWFRTVSAVLLSLTLGCHEKVTSPTEPLPAAPSPPPPTSADEVWLRGVVFDTDGRCLPDAVVVMTEGRRAGVEVRNDCTQSPWGHYGGYLFTELRDRDVFTLRATAPGHLPREVTATLIADMDGQDHHNIVLSRE